MEKSKIEENKKLVDLAFTCMIARGVTIDTLTQAEDLLTSIIAWCFYPVYEELDGEIDKLLTDQAIALKSLILRELSFQKKIKLIDDCIEIVNIEIYHDNRHLIKEIKQNLEASMKFRNLLAHSPMDSSKEYLRYTVGVLNNMREDFQILEYKKGKVHKRLIKEEETKAEVHRVFNTCHKLLQLWALLRNKPEEAKQHEIIGSMKSSEFGAVLKKMGF